MAADFELDEAELEQLLRSPQAIRILGDVGNEVRDRARDNVAGAADPRALRALRAELGEDAEGVYVDVGYRRNAHGFYLMFLEVGTEHVTPHPHLRPAVRPVD